MDFTHFLQGLERSSVGDYVATSNWGFPIIETVHVTALVLVVGSIAVMDLRLLGLASRAFAVTRLSNDILKFTWGAFVLAVLTGSLMFISKATSYAINPYFQWKMILIVLAGLNMAYFHLFTWKSVHEWDTSPILPVSAKIAGGLSLLFWVGVVFLGRMVGFTLDIYF